MADALTKKRYFFTLILAFAFLSNTAKAEMMLFVGDGCSHCEGLEAYLQENNFYTKYDIQQYEVFNNIDNRNLYIQKNEELGLKGNSVPLLLNNNDRIEGARAIEKYLETYENMPRDGYISVLNNDELKDLGGMIKSEQDKNNSKIIYQGIIVLISLITGGLLIFLFRKRKG